MSRLVLLIMIAGVAVGQRRGPVEPVPELLWPNGAPGALGQEDIDKPSITAYLAVKPNGKAVVVMPGGGYGALAIDHEGKQIAQWLNSQGISAFVLKYRLGPKYHHPVELGDAARAVRSVRAGAVKWKIQPDKIGVWGFSAGGHLASSISTHFDAGDGKADDAIERFSSRPDFSILSYPVITFTKEQYVHKGSRKNLLGDNPDAKLVEYLSSENQVTAQTPPTFLFHTNADTGVPPENSIYYYLALRKAGVAAEMHVYENGPHGVGLAPADLVLSSWGPRLADWLRNR